MDIVKLILKEAGGRIENAAGAIDSDDNMFKGSSGNAISDKIGGGENNNPVADNNNASTPEAASSETVPETDTATTDTNDLIESDGRVKTDYNSYAKTDSGKLSGKLKNLDLDPLSSKPVTSNSSGGGGFSQFMKGFGGGTDTGADVTSEVDAGDVADVASDERLKRIFGDNEDAIKSFAKINAIKFVYNDKAREISQSDAKGVDTDPHYGVKAQDLAANPLTETTVSKDPISEYLQVDTRELTMANTAIISEICKRILAIEKVLGIKVV